MEPEAPIRGLTAWQIVDEVAAKHGINRERMIKRPPRYEDRFARYEAAARLRAETIRSISEIARMFNVESVLFWTSRHYQVTSGKPPQR